LIMSRFQRRTARFILKNLRQSRMCGMRATDPAGSGRAGARAVSGGAKQTSCLLTSATR
jgi:hypothetical protein